MKSWIGGAAILMAASPGIAWAQPERPADRALGAFTSPRLTPFESDEQLLDYLAAAQAAARARNLAWAKPGVQYASLQTDQPDPPPCPEDEPDCLEVEDGLNDLPQSITVTGSRIAAPSNPSITNNQMAGVEEGDIVKQIGQFLVVLQDGRLFVINTRGDGNGRLALTDRRNVYRSRHDVDWYDEMLVRGDRILVTAYSYGQRATEISVLRLDAAGKLSPEGVFYMSSNDYYDSSNYATRLVGDNLVVYTPIALAELREDRGFGWPVVRRWVDDEEGVEERGRPLLDARAVYRPVRTTYEPYIHTISVCPLTSVATAEGLQCRATAFVAPAGSEFYVTDEHAYLWTVPGWSERRMTADGRDEPPLCSTLRRAPGMPATLFRVAVDGSAPAVLGARGLPADQFSMEARSGRFQALTLQQPTGCQTEWRGGTPPPLAYLSTAIASFGPVLADAPPSAYTRLPSVGSQWIANRFSDDYLVYGALTRGRSGRPARAYAVPLARPGSPVSLDVPHTVIRAERAGRNIVLTGYERRSALDISLIDLRGRPEIASTLELPGRAESEGRSHAFNSLIEEDGGGLMGLPTVNSEENPRYPWRSDASDISFIQVSEAGELHDAGRLDSRVPEDDQETVGDPDYKCEVSCIDWYGNSRPIFTDGRVFALTGNELIEGRLRSGRIRELRRLDLTRPVGTRSPR
jgi:hypothetical protein